MLDLYATWRSFSAATSGHDTGDGGGPFTPEGTTKATLSKLLDEGEQRSHGVDDDAVRKTTDPGSIHVRPTSDASPESANGGGFVGPKERTQEPGLEGVSGVADAAGTVLDWTSRYMEARKLIGVGSGAHGGLGFVSIVLMASSAYEQSNGPLEFAREIAKSVAMDQVGKAIVRYTLAGAEGAIEGAPLGPVGAATAGTAAVLTLTYGGSIIDGVSSYGRREANQFYAYLDGEIRRLYGYPAYWPR